ncbi:GGDEF domain-containing protein [Thiorhodovibrio frisius]|uniref:diguanylate cyclase n=1 Tax=Thiorhodovibrio frisius TaxID=631362 RepID=H8Z741_9GAMM|nr:GGDEF domain-containing protein [Thiorhodovibrio frisius]EIC20840.1 diguanylate cyclase (GGDEF) domain-containing protein [Thiorhodovibrio frisius]WPL21892.1 putative diguanylate cyclase YcdT [Thiorhodovibrio frisius]
MSYTETPEFQAALFDFALASGYLIMVELDADGLIVDHNNGFTIALRPTGEARGKALSEFLRNNGNERPEIVPGLPNGTPVPYVLNSWTDQDILMYAYPLPDQHALLIGSVTSPDESQATQSLSRMTTEMANLVRELRHANRRVMELAHTDGLTGLANRRCFLERLDLTLLSAQRQGQPVALLMMDLDHFKQINDRFGHAGGDAVLKAFADLLREGSRAGDLSGRLGGEEFVLMLPNTNVEKGRKVAERTRIATAKLRPLGEPHRVTVSIGLAILQDGDNANLLLARSDQALYAAKKAGRNCVVVTAN